MLDTIQDKRPQLAVLCRRFGVRTLDLFASAATGAFNAATNDLDFIVDLGGYDVTVVDRFLDLADALKALFDRPVDLITVKSVRSPVFRAEVERSRIPLYDARGDQAAA